MSLFTLTPAELNAHALAEGFDLAGVAALDHEGAPGSASSAVTGSCEREQYDLVSEARDAVEQGSASYLEKWIAQGYAGEMDYLKRRNETGELLRARVRAAIPWARSVIVCATRYDAPGPRSLDPAPPGAGWIARYAWAGQPDPATGELRPSDYHDTLLVRLRHLEDTLHAAMPEPFGSRSYVDTGPFIERDLARRAGIGWIGKNTCTLNQQLGSMFFIGCIVTSLEVPPSLRPLPAEDRCGTCRRCIEACPTDALIAPRQMDASRCIAYLTIEKRGPIPEELRAPIGRQVFGCDICQEVCPWTRNVFLSGYTKNTQQDISEARFVTKTRGELVNPALEWLASLDAREFNQKFAGSPVKRTKRSGLLRNVAIAMGNSGDAQFLPRLAAWAAAPDQDPVLAETASWAIAQIKSLK